MTTTTTRNTTIPAEIAPPRGILYRPKATSGFWSWWTTVDHKKIGILYGGLGLVFFLIAGIEALLIGLQPAGPNRTSLTPRQSPPPYPPHLRLTAAATPASARKS